MSLLTKLWQRTAAYTSPERIQAAVFDLGCKFKHHKCVWYDRPPRVRILLGGRWRRSHVGGYHKHVVGFRIELHRSRAILSFDLHRCAEFVGRILMNNIEAIDARGERQVRCRIEATGIRVFTNR